MGLMQPSLNESHHRTETRAPPPATPSTGTSETFAAALSRRRTVLGVQQRVDAAPMPALISIMPNTAPGHPLRFNQ
jgi:hypothetical protein